MAFKTHLNGKPRWQPVILDPVGHTYRVFDGRVTVVPVTDRGDGTWHAIIVATTDNRYPVGGWQITVTAMDLAAGSRFNFDRLEWGDGAHVVAPATVGQNAVIDLSGAHVSVDEVLRAQAGPSAA